MIKKLNNDKIYCDFINRNNGITQLKSIYPYLEEVYGDIVSLEDKELYLKLTQMQ